MFKNKRVDIKNGAKLPIKTKFAKIEEWSTSRELAENNSEKSEINHLGIFIYLFITYNFAKDPESIRKSLLKM